MSDKRFTRRFPGGLSSYVATDGWESTLDKLRRDDEYDPATQGQPRPEPPKCDGTGRKTCPAWSKPLKFDQHTDECLLESGFVPRSQNYARALRDRVNRGYRGFWI